MGVPALELPACALRAWSDHRRELEAFARDRLQSRPDAEDLVQDLVVKLAAQGSAFCSIDNPRAWLFTALRHAIVDHHRRQRPREDVHEDLPAPEPVVPDPVDRLAECLAKVLPDLGPADAHILGACELSGMKLADYARREGLGLPAVKSRLQRARRRLRERLVEACAVRFDERGSVCCHGPARHP